MFIKALPFADLYPNFNLSSLSTLGYQFKRLVNPLLGFQDFQFVVFSRQLCLNTFKQEATIILTLFRSLFQPSLTILVDFLLIFHNLL